MDKRTCAGPREGRGLRGSVTAVLRACALVVTVLLAYTAVTAVLHPRSRGTGLPRGRPGAEGSVPTGGARGNGPPGSAGADRAGNPDERRAEEKAEKAEEDSEESAEGRKRIVKAMRQLRDSRIDLVGALAHVHTHGARFAVAVYDTTTGNSGAYGDGAFDTASIVKIDILAALLLHAQHAHRGLTEAERAAAAVMVRQSDNAAATALWRRIGGADGLDEANERLGLTGTRGDQDDAWGLTQTTATGQLALLQAVFGDDSPLDASSRRYLQDLMGKVDPDQRWGVSAAADQSSASALKNGWLQRSTTGLWDINSIGRVGYGGHSLLVAVLSSGNATQTGGVCLVEAAARTAVRTVVQASRRARTAAP